MKTYVISLIRSKDRRERLSQQLNALDIQYEFFDAVDASENRFLNSEKQNASLCRKRLGYAISNAELACFSSHFEIWKRCIKNNEPVLVLEDNIDLEPHFMDGYKQLALLTNKYSYIKLAATRKVESKEIETIDDNLSIVRFNKKTCGTTGYVITPDAAQKLVDGAHLFIEPVDNYMEKPYKHQVIAYNLYPDLVSRAAVSSTIGAKRKIKQNLSLTNKLYIEAFRFYEQVRNVITVYTRLK